MKLAALIGASFAFTLFSTTVSAQPSCAPSISPDLCRQAQVALSRHLARIAAADNRPRLDTDLLQKPERPVPGSPCFFRYGRDLAGTVTRCVMPRPMANPRPDQPVMFEASSRDDACGSHAMVVGLDPRGDNYLSVRAGPSGQHRETDRLGTGAEVAICHQSGDWFGVIYSHLKPTGECGGSSPSPRTRAYRGPCQSGWVHRRHILVTIG
jgi:hypothetical protein